MSWDAIEPLVRGLPPEIGRAVRRVAEAAGPRDRRAALRALVSTLGAEAGGFALSLTHSADPEARRLALELVTRLRSPGRTIRGRAVALLARRDLPLAVRLSATRALLRRVRPDGPGAVRLLRSFAAGLGRRRPLQRLDRLADKLGRPPALAVVRGELVSRQKLRCPRCGALRRRGRMAEHLWNHHQLLLDGHRARPPLKLLDERLSDPDPISVLSELHRTILTRGLKDDEALEQLCAEAATRHESVCPNCFATVPVAEPPPLTPAELSPGRLVMNRCTITLSEHGLRPRVTAEMDGRRVVDTTAADRPLTPGALRWLSAGCGVAGLAAAALLPSPWHALTAAALFGEGAVLLRLARNAERLLGDRTDRVIDVAWQHLAGVLPPGEALGRLALASVGRGRPVERARQLDASMSAADSAPANVVAALWWLHADDGRRGGRDLIPELAARLGTCFAGATPLACAAGLMDFALPGLRSRAERARLRVLACQQAFERGLGVWDLVEIGRAFPPLARSLVTDDLDGLARLRLVWEHRADRPWQTCGPASTVFELARYPVLVGQALSDAPDLLLYQPLPPPGPGDDPAPVLLCGRGVLFRGTVLRERPRVVRVRHREVWRGGGYELRLGPHSLRFADDPSALAERLTRWAGYFLGDFLPRADTVLRYRAGDRLDALLRPYTSPCPACGQAVVPVPGRVAVARD